MAETEYPPWHRRHEGGGWSSEDERWKTEICTICGKPADNHYGHEKGYCGSPDGPRFTTTPLIIKSLCASCGHSWDEHTGDAQSADITDTRCTYPDGAPLQIGSVGYRAGVDIAHCTCLKFEATR